MNMETRMDEVKLTTSNPDEMLYKFISKRVIKTWHEDFVDSDTGKVETIERSSTLFEKGTYVDADVLSQILFFINEGSVTEIEVSNQKRRTAFCLTYIQNKILRRQLPKIYNINIK